MTFLKTKFLTALCLTTAISSVAFAAPSDVVQDSLKPQNIIPVPSTLQGSAIVSEFQEENIKLDPTVTQASVMQETLEPLSPDTVGLLQGKQSLGDDMWQGTHRRTVEFLLSILPHNEHSPTLQKLRYQLLLSASDAPKGSGMHENLLELRIRQLAAMGNSKITYDFTQKIPDSYQTEYTRLIELDYLFSQQQYDKACDIVAHNSNLFQSAAWQQETIICQMLEGEYEKAELGLTLLEEQGNPAPALFKETLASLITPEGGDSPAIKTSTIEALQEQIRTAVNNNTEKPALVKAELSDDILALLDNNKTALDSKALQNWWYDISVLENEDKVAKLSRLFTLMESFDQDIPTAEWYKLLHSSTQPPKSVVLRNLLFVSAEKRVGETIALSLIALGDKPLTDVDSNTITEVVAALKRIQKQDVVAHIAQESLTKPSDTQNALAPSNVPSYHEAPSQQEILDHVNEHYRSQPEATGNTGLSANEVNPSIRQETTGAN